jgi:hypothetical protein
VAARRRKQRKLAEAKGEPLVLWWMPFVALLAPIAFAAWKMASANGDALGAGAWALVWPGVALYVAALAVLWSGWKIELE